MAKPITQKEKLKMYVLYQQLGSYTAVAKKLHRDRQTVSKYVNLIEASGIVTTAINMETVVVI